MTTALIAAQSAENRARDKRADERLGHDDAGEQKCAAAAEINQTGNEAAPVVRELFPNQKNQGNQSDRRQRTRKPRRCSVYAEKLERDNNEPVEQRRFLQARDSVVRGHEPLIGLDHLACRAGILSLGLAVKIACADRRHV